MKKLTLTVILGLLVGTVAPYAYSQFADSPGENSVAGGAGNETIQNTAFMERAKRAIRLELKGSENVQFKNTRLVRNDEGLLVACGEVEADSTQGIEEASSGRFVSMGHPESVSIEGRTANVNALWGRYCSSS